jgi:hypothetical protein
MLGCSQPRFDAENNKAAEKLRGLTYLSAVDLWDRGRAFADARRLPARRQSRLRANPLLLI